jgi:hypothetical protein
MPCGKIRRIAIHLCTIASRIAGEGPANGHASEKQTTQITYASIVGIMKCRACSARRRKADRSRRGGGRTRYQQITVHGPGTKS